MCGQILKPIVLFQCFQHQNHMKLYGRLCLSLSLFVGKLFINDHIVLVEVFFFAKIVKFQQANKKIQSNGPIVIFFFRFVFPYGHFHFFFLFLHCKTLIKKGCTCLFVCLVACKPSTFFFYLIRFISVDSVNIEFYSQR